MKKWIVVLLVAVVGGLALWRTWPGWKPGGLTASAQPVRPSTAVAAPRTIDFRVMAAGDIGPAEQVSVRPEINGRIKTLPVDIGDRVKAGEVLFTLDDSDLQIERSSRVTEIEAAKLQLEKAERNYERSKQLFEEDLISKEVFQDARTEFDLAKNSLERANKNLGLVEERLTKTIIAAPFDCTVLTRSVSVGQAVSGSSGFNSGTEVMTIADLNNMIVNAHVNQADVTRLTPGQEVDIQVESVPGLSLKGTVERVAPQSTIKNGIKGYAARIAINKENLDPRIRPGMTANLSIPVASSENALAVPLAAIFTEDGERFVLVKKGDQFEKRPVRIGIADYDYVEVQSGLQPGEVVALEDYGQAAARSERGGAPGGMRLTSGRPEGRAPSGSPSTRGGGTNATTTTAEAQNAAAGEGQNAGQQATKESGPTATQAGRVPTGGSSGTGGTAAGAGR